MKRYVLILTLGFASLTLSACVSRDQADARLANGCAAGAELFLTEGNKIKEIKDKIFRDDPDLGKGYREVRLFVVQSDGWYDQDQEYKCIFSESLGLTGHTATIYQLQLNGQTYGKKGEELLGTYEDHLKLTETVEQGMNRP